MKDIKDEFEKGELSYIDAIDALQQDFGFGPLDAERLVSEWQDALSLPSTSGGTAT